MDTENKLWAFANDFYAAPNVANQLLRLQNTYQVSINQLIYAVWLATQHHQLKCLPKHSDETHTWRSEIAIPLRTLRFQVRQIKQDETLQYSGVDACYRQLLEAELAAERVELNLLAKALSRYSQAAEQHLDVDKIVRENLILCWRDNASHAPEIPEPFSNFIELACNYVISQ